MGRTFLLAVLAAALAVDVWTTSSSAQALPAGGPVAGAPRARLAPAGVRAPAAAPYRTLAGAPPGRERPWMIDLPAAAEPAAARASRKGDDPRLDRMLVRTGGVRIDTSFSDIAGGGRCPGIAVRARAEGAWREAGGLRVRVNYLKPEGFTTADRAGLHFDAPEYRGNNPDVVLPSRYWGSYAVYHPGDRVAYEIELENAGPEALEGLALTAWQEEFNPAGTGGRRLPGAGNHLTVASLAPGGRVVLRGRLTIAGPWATRSNFEQTHLRIARVSPGGSARVVADLAQAGVVDPPRP